MDDLCSGCLCNGRKLFKLSETGYEHIYTQIINEIPLYNTLEMSVRVCWECKALLRKMDKFKDQVKICYTELIGYVQQNTPLYPNCPRLRSQLVNLEYVFEQSSESLIKQENNDSSPLGDDLLSDKRENNHCSPLGDDVLHGGDDFEVKDEEYHHCEPETFVNDLNVAKVKKKKSVKKIDKQMKQKSKEKLSIKKVKEKRSKTKLVEQINNIVSTAEDVIDNNCDTDLYKQDNILAQNNEGNEDIKESEVTVNTNGVKKRAPPGTLAEKPVCGECGKTFSSRKTYRYHLNVLHKGQNRYPCPRCGKVYQWKSNLGRHMRSHKASDSGELYCETCDKKFASVATYRQHLRISKRHVSESEFSFICNDCGKKFVNKTRLRDHIDWEHLKKIKFICQLCNKPFKCHTSLYVHKQNVHRSKDKKDNLCHVCGKSYQNAAKLKYHIVAMHTSETPYQCQQCTASFGWYSSLYRHVREVHYKMKVQPKKSKKMLKPDF